MKTGTVSILQAAIVVSAVALLGFGVSRSLQQGFLLNLAFASAGALATALVLATAFVVGRSLTAVGWKPLKPKRSLRLFFAAFSVGMLSAIVGLVFQSTGPIAYVIVLVSGLVCSGSVLLPSRR